MISQFKSFLMLENKLAIISDTSVTHYDRIKKLTYNKIFIHKRQTAIELFCQSTMSRSIIILKRTVNIGQKDQGGATEPASGR